MKTQFIVMIMEICEKYKIEFLDIFSVRRAKEISHARKVICWILRKEGLSLKEIGLFLKKDHSSVLHAITTISDEDKSYAQVLYRKHHKKESLENLKKEQELLEKKLPEITRLLNEGKNLKEIAKIQNDTYDNIDKLFSLYICEKKIPNYSTYSQKSEFFYKIIKKNY